jgi:hypothetical protein
MPGTMRTRHTKISYIEGTHAHETFHLIYILESFLILQKRWNRLERMRIYLGLETPYNIVQNFTTLFRVHVPRKLKLYSSNWWLFDYHFFAPVLCRCHIFFLFLIFFLQPEFNLNTHSFWVCVWVGVLRWFMDTRVIKQWEKRERKREMCNNFHWHGTKKC